MVRRLLLVLAAIVTAVPAAAALLTWSDLTGRVQPQPDATVAYGPDTLQVVDVWLPAGRPPFRTVVMVHGGCWTSRIADRRLMNLVAGDLRSAGYAVWNIDYRGVDRAGGGYPGTFRDAAAATDALRANAARFGLDTRRIVAVGHSAGGHLALWLAARGRLPADSPLRTPDPLPIASVVSLGGLPDLAATAASPDNGCGTEVVGKLVGTGRADPYTDTSVVPLLPLGVPQHLVNGRDDTIIPLRLADGYLARATASGDAATLDVVPATGHVELIAPDSAAWATARRRIAAAFAP